LTAFLALGAFATQDTSFTDREIRDPKKLKVKLEANATDAESRLVAAGVTTAANITLTNSADSGTASVRLDVDKNDDAGDANKILVPNGGGFKFQSDSASKGTLADILAFGATGIVTLKGGATLDNSASATELNITETTVKVTGALTVTGTITATTPIAQNQIATNNVGVKTISWTCAGGTNFVLTANAQGIITALTATAP